MSFADQVRRFAELPRPASRRVTFSRAFAVQRRVIQALMVRSALSRFGHENLGFFWLMGEPLAMTVGVMAMWTVAGMDKGHGVGIIPFALTGYTLLTLWRHIVSFMSHAMTNNAGLMFHRNVRMMDILIGTVVLESLGGLAAFFIAYIPLYFMDLVPAIDDPLLLLGAWLIMTWLGFGFGIIVAALSEFSHALAHLIPAFMYVTLPATGVFYMLHWLPQAAQQVLVWSPLVHPFEMFRGGLFGPVVEAQYDVTFMVIVCTILTAIGLGLTRIAEKHVHVS